jgi:hypothetical protein
MSITATNQTRALSDAELDHVGGGIRQINQLGTQIVMMQFNGVLDPLWEIVGKTGHLPTPGEY